MSSYKKNNPAAGRDASAQRIAQAQQNSKGPYRIIENVNERPDVSVSEGLVIYQLDTNKMYVSDGATWQDLWTAYSDGATSGLDADLLDGQHGAFYQDAGNINAGVLATARGGTSNGTYAIGDLLYASTTSLLTRLTAVATGNALISGGANTAPSWGKIGLTTHVSGTLAVANGGTGFTTTAPTSPVNAPRRNGTFLTMSASTERYLRFGKLTFMACEYTFSSAATTAGTEIDVYIPNGGQPVAGIQTGHGGTYFDSSGATTHKLTCEVVDSGASVYRVRFKRNDDALGTYLGVNPNPAASLVGDILQFSVWYWTV